MPKVKLYKYTFLGLKILRDRSQLRNNHKTKFTLESIRPLFPKKTVYILHSYSGPEMAMRVQCLAGMQSASLKCWINIKLLGITSLFNSNAFKMQFAASSLAGTVLRRK